MKILITNHCLYNQAGTENYVFEIAQYFAQNGHEVFVYSPLVGRAVYDSVSDDICIVNDLKKIQDIKFDVIHSHHNKTAMLVRFFFPHTPMLFLSHGILPALEQPPTSDMYISFYGAVSEEVEENIVNNHGIEKDRVVIIRNFVDFARFRSKKAVNSTLKNVLVVSNHYSGEVRKNIESVCNKKKLSLTHIGLPDNPVDDVENYINDTDLVITLGKGVLEAIACKRNVIVYDKHGCDGFMTRELYYESRKNNFSGRRFGKKMTEHDLELLFEKYDPSNCESVYNIIKSNHSMEEVCEGLLGSYDETIKAHEVFFKNNQLCCSENFCQKKEIFLYKFFIFYLKVRYLKKIKFLGFCRF